MPIVLRLDVPCTVLEGPILVLRKTRQYVWRRTVSVCVRN